MEMTYSQKKALLNTLETAQSAIESLYNETGSPYEFRCHDKTITSLRRSLIEAWTYIYDNTTVIK